MQGADAAGCLWKSGLFVRRVSVLIEYLGRCSSRFLSCFPGPYPLGAGVDIFTIHWRNVRIHFLPRIDRLSLIFDVYLSPVLLRWFESLSLFYSLISGHMFHVSEVEDLADLREVHEWVDLCALVG